MAALSNYAEQRFVEHFLRNNPVSSPATVYLALYTSDPGEDNTGTEAIYTNYARKPVTWTALDANGQTKNAAKVEFEANGNASSNVVVTHAAIFDAATAGNMIIHGSLGTPKTLQPGDVLAFAISALVLSID